jgi:hypothetical protein
MRRERDRLAGGGTERIPYSSAVGWCSREQFITAAIYRDAIFEVPIGIINKDTHVLKSLALVIPQKTIADIQLAF